MFSGIGSSPRRGALLWPWSLFCSPGQRRPPPTQFPNVTNRNSRDALMWMQFWQGKHTDRFREQSEKNQTRKLKRRHDFVKSQYRDEQRNMLYLLRWKQARGDNSVWRNVETQISPKTMGTVSTKWRFVFGATTISNAQTAVEDGGDVS